MDRLSTLAIALAVASASGCESKQEPPKSRFDTTKVAEKKVDTAAFCDVQFAGTTGPKLTIPKLVGGDLPASTGTWRWINVWATWCKPCIEEMPRLVAWREKLGKRYDLAFVSADENDADLADARKEHPELPASPRLADPGKQADWYVALGLDGGAPLPIHIFVEPSGHVRCARAGGVREQDYAAVEKVLSQ